MKRYLSTICACLCLSAAPVFAQETDAQWLFSCQLNGGANSVGVHVYDDEITYHYANADGAIELNLNDNVADISLILALWDEPNFTESVTFNNGDTSYEIFSEAGRNRPLGDRPVLMGGAVDGGVLVTTPDGVRTEILCDPSTIEPKNPLLRFARLQSMRDANFTFTEDCSASGAMTETGCANVLKQLCNDGLQNGEGEMTCVLDDRNRRELSLTNAYASAQLMARERGDVEALEQAQEIWVAGRDADCALAAWTVYNVLDGDMGQVSCMADYATKRVEFLEAYMSGLEFDG